MWETQKLTAMSERSANVQCKAPTKPTTTTTTTLPLTRPHAQTAPASKYELRRAQHLQDPTRKPLHLDHHAKRVNEQPLWKTHSFRAPMLKKTSLGTCHFFLAGKIIARKPISITYRFSKPSLSTYVLV